MPGSWPSGWALSMIKWKMQLNQNRRIDKLKPAPQIGIYRITHIDSGRFYIGSSVNIRQRWWGHQHDLRTKRHKNSRLQNYWNKYGEAAFRWEVVEEVEKLSLNEREQQFLDAQRPFFNINPSADRGGMGRKRGYVTSAETRAKISRANKGKRHSPEFCEAIRKRQTGRVPSAEHRRRQSIAMKGKTFTIKPGRPIWQRKLTHCLDGHPLPTELRADGRRRNCKICGARRYREWLQRKRLGIALVA